MIVYSVSISDLFNVSQIQSDSVPGAEKWRSQPKPEHCSAEPSRPEVRLRFRLRIAEAEMFEVIHRQLSFCRENGAFEEVIDLPSHSRLSPPEGQEEQQQPEERVPIVAFTENGLLKPLSGVEDISAQQGPGNWTSVVSSSFFSLQFFSAFLYDVELLKFVSLIMYL